MLSRRWMRIIVQLVFVITLLSLVVLFTDRYEMLPTSVHTKLPTHRPGTVITDVKLVACMTKSLCNAEADEEWEKIPKDLYLGKNWSRYQYLFVKRQQEDDLSDEDLVVSDVAIQPSDVDTHEGWQRRGHLWVKFEGLKKESVTDMDILFGRDAAEARQGWGLRNGVIGGILTEPRISIKHGRPANPISKLKVGGSGKYKILQIADLHLSTGVGECMDPLPEYAAGCEADPRTIDFYKRLLDLEHPDFVVLTGDQIYGGASPDSQTSMLKAVAPLVERKIPYAMIFGNHDDEGSLDREELMKFVETLPYCLSTRGPESIMGVGNFVLTVQGQNDDPAMTLYFLDTHKRLPNQKKTPGYDHIKQNQIDWLLDQYHQLQPKQKKYSLIHLSMAFVHIPLPEYVRKGNRFIGNFWEGSTAPRFNSHARDALVKAGVSVVDAGHDHVNDYCMFDDHSEEEKGQVWLCHGGAIGEGGYAGYKDYIRRARTFEIDTEAGSISTWKYKNVPELEKFDFQTLVNGGNVQHI